MATPLTPPERQLKLFLGICAVVYAGGAVAFPTLGHLVFDLFNWVSPASLPPIPPRSESFWMTLASSMMGTIAVCCWLGAKDPVRNRDMALPVVMAKAVSTAAGLLFFALASQRHFAYLGVAITDLPLCVATYLLWKRAGKTG
jgi:hypothetical protein